LKKKSSEENKSFLPQETKTKTGQILQDIPKAASGKAANSGSMEFLGGKLFYCALEVYPVDLVSVGY